MSVCQFPCPLYFTGFNFRKNWQIIRNFGYSVKVHKLYVFKIVAVSYKFFYRNHVPNFNISSSSVHQNALATIYMSYWQQWDLKCIWTRVLQRVVQPDLIQGGLTFNRFFRVQAGYNQIPCGTNVNNNKILYQKNKMVGKNSLKSIFLKITCLRIMYLHSKHKNMILGNTL